MSAWLEDISWYLLTPLLEHMLLSLPKDENPRKNLSLKGWKQIFELLERLDSHLPTITNLQNVFAGNPEKLVYCHEFMYHYDWVKHAPDKCQVVLKVRVRLKKDVEEHMTKYTY